MALACDMYPPCLLTSSTREPLSNLSQWEYTGGAGKPWSLFPFHRVEMCSRVTRLGLRRWPQASSLFRPRRPGQAPAQLPGALRGARARSPPLRKVNTACSSTLRAFSDARLTIWVHCLSSKRQKAFGCRSSVLLCLLVYPKYNQSSFGK